MALLSVSFLDMTAYGQSSIQNPDRKIPKPVKIDDVPRWQKLMRHSVDFFEVHAYDEKSGCYRITFIEILRFVGLRAHGMYWEGEDVGRCPVIR
jgi:hypothetical protein